jgi:protein O-mannosyl-transferase
LSDILHTAPASARAPIAVAPSKRSLWAIAIAVLALTVFAYWPAFQAGYIWDDDSYVTENPAIQSASGLGEIWGLTREPVHGALVSNTPQYYPLVFTTFWIEHQVWGLDPAGYHVVNVLLHAANALLVFLLLRRLAVPSAWFVAALFAVHPLHVESVAWITERKNVLSGLFYLSAFLAYLRFDETRRARFWFAALALFLCALLSKSVTATLPVALLIALFWRHQRLVLRDIALVVPFLVLGAISGWFTAYLEQVKVGAQGTEFGQTLLERSVLIVPRAYGFYALKSLVPYPITFVYERWEPHFGDVTALASFAALAIAGILLIVLRKRIGWGPFLLALASAVTLAPALGFVPVFPHRYSWVADHFAYLGSLGFLALWTVAGLWLARRWVPSAVRERVLTAIAMVVLTVFAARSHVEARSYANSERLWRDTLAENPEAWIASINLGIEIMKQPRVTKTNANQAFALFQSAERHPLGKVQALTNEAQWLLLAGRVNDAAETYRRALAESPQHPAALEGLANALGQQAEAFLAEGKDSDALSSVRRALLDIGPDVRFLRLEAWIAATSRDERLRNGEHAKQLATKLVLRSPDDWAMIDTLAAALAECGDFDGAVMQGTRALDCARRAHADSQLAGLEARLALYRTKAPYRSTNGH